MSKFYDVVKKVINTSDFNEASNILYGNEGIFINGDEYFNNLVSNFIRKKEYIIKRHGNKLVFDLKNYNDIWNVVFLGEYIKENDTLHKEYNKFLNELKELEDELDNIVHKHKTATTKEEHESINEEYNTFKEQVNSKRDISDNYKKVIDTFYNIDWVELENSSDEIEALNATNILKQSINIIHKLRNNIQHGIAEVDDEIKIDNDNFNVTIPIEYLDGFTKGRIIANDKDQIIVERTNTISSPLLEALGYDVKEVESLFYNVKPSYLSYLLEKVDYNYDKLYRMNINIFNNEKSFKYFIDNNINLECINSFNEAAFENPKLAVELYNKGVDLHTLSSAAYENYEVACELIKNGININKISDGAFYNKNAALLFFKKGIDLTKLPNSAFYNVGSTLVFRKLGNDIYNLPHCCYEFPKLTMELLDRGISVDEISKLPYIAFELTDSTINLCKNGIDVTKVGYFAFEFSENVLKLKRNSVDVHRISSQAFMDPDVVFNLINDDIDVYKLPDSAFKHVEEIYKLRNYGIDIYNLSEEAFFSAEETIELYQNKIDINKLSWQAFSDVKKTIELYNKGIDIYNLSKEALFRADETIKLYQHGIDVNKLPERAFIWAEETLKLHKHKINVYKLPDEAFRDSDKTLKLYNSGIDIYNLPEISFFDCNKTISIFQHGIDLYKLPNKCFHYNSKINNIKHLLDLTDNNYEKLNELPEEFFECELSLVDEMYRIYNENVAKSIFGINNPKLIATMVYCDSILKNYQKENADYDLIDFTPFQLICSCYNDTMKYKNNITDLDMDRSMYLNQFVMDENGDERSIDSLKNNILNKMRNSICHFRFKPVKDEDGNVVEDKVYLYDKFDNSEENNFNLIIDINKLVDITNQIELSLENKNMESRQHTR